MKRILSIILIFSFLSSFVNARTLLNNFEKIDNDLSVSYDRYGRDSESAEKDNDGFSYFWRSALIPGWGEYKLGLKKQAAAFFITDIFLLATAAGLNYYSDLREDEYKDFAVLYAGVNPSGKSEGYWVDVANYDNTDDYNEQKNIDRYFNERYEDEDDRWDWVSESKRKKYDDIRISSETGSTWFYYSLGGMALNHFLSALNASGKASRLKSTVIQTVENNGGLKHELKLTYEF